ncbi:MAG: ubiquinone/menaquinone biosynthesis methyltransferase [Humidesulfovibrio sp.]|nr:ubiquinone/menaquinone biosynthesis methyltransferase [Humidesulfovibrio sp.]
MQRPPSTEQSQRDQLHGRQVAAMFGRIARWYDFLNHTLSLGLDIYWRWRLARVALPEPGGAVLDLAAGTLDVSLALIRQYPDIRVAAVDYTLPMLVRGKHKLTGGPDKRILPVQGDGRKLPLADESMDAATIAFGIRNIRPRMAAHREVLRCLKPGGRFCILEFGTGRRKVWGGLYNFYLESVLPALGRLVSGDRAAYRYLAETIREFPDERQLSRELMDAGYARVFHVAMLSGIVYLHVAEKAGQLCADADKEAGVKTQARAVSAGRDGILRCFTPQDPGKGPDEE